ncbi:hypothetical protein SRHO_G00072320 [Serrasalmus rhombeus]
MAKTKSLIEKAKTMFTYHLSKTSAVDTEYRMAMGSSSPSTADALCHSSVVTAQDQVQNSGSSWRTISFNFGDSPLSEEWKQRVAEKLNSIPDVFALGDLDYGHTTAVKHRIRLSDPTPFKQRVRPIHPSDYEAVRLHLQELRDANIIRESESPFSSPIVVVKKKNGAIRLCVDYRKLNNQTIKDAYALPNIEETFSALSGSKWFSVMDLKSGYYQVELEEEDKHKTAFVTPMGFWEFNRMPQGVTNAPSTFQRVMEKCVGSMNLKEVLVFLDNLIVFSSTLEEHEDRLLRVLKRLKEFGLKLSPDKCHFFRKTVRYLGHVVSENGVETDPEKIAALTTWPRPNNLRELKSFLGFTGYYRRFVKDYSKIARPLNNLTVGYLPPKRSSDLGRVRSKVNISLNWKRPFNERWTEECETAFRTLIQKLTSAPVLGFADPKQPYILHTDASLHGLGAALYQEQDGQLRVVAYASRGLSKCERRYATHKLEFLALKWAVTDKFFDYLYGAKFTVMTDNNPLTYVLTSAKLDAAGHRWLAALSSFDFCIQYRAGKMNQDADGLSRRPHAPTGQEDDVADEDDRVKQIVAQFTAVGQPTLSEAAVRAICQRFQVCGSVVGDALVAVDCLAMGVNAIPDDFVHLQLAPGSNTLPQMSQQDWALEQRYDTAVSRVIDIVKSQKRLPYRARRREDQEVQLMLRIVDQFVINDEVLYRKCTIRGEPHFQLVLPRKFRSSALEGLHDAVGHLGIERTVDLVRFRFYWPRMFMDVREKILKCERCIRRKAKAERNAPLVNIKTSRPLELVCMDYLSLEPDGRGTKNILVITDHFTKYAVAVPTSDQKAKTVAKVLWNNFFVHYGLPERLHSDQGRDFESCVIKDLCQMLGIKKTRTTPYHPRGNPVERFNRTLLEMLGTLEEENKAVWRDHVQPLVHAYNCTRNDTTGFSPYQLMFGRQPSLPIDLAFGLTPDGPGKESHLDYVKRLQDTLRESYKLAIEHSDKVAQRNKLRYDSRVRESVLETGDRVLVRNIGLRGKHKLADRWSQTIYRVVKRVGDNPVYVVTPLNAGGPERTLHRDLLLPCGFLPTHAAEPAQLKTPETVTRPPHNMGRETDSPESSDWIAEDTCQVPVCEVVEYQVPQSTTWVETIEIPIERGLISGKPKDLSQSQNQSSVSDVQSDIEPRREVRSTPETMGLEKSDLNPEAKVFHPQTSAVSSDKVDSLDQLSLGSAVSVVSLPETGTGQNAESEVEATETTEPSQVSEIHDMGNQLEARAAEQSEGDFEPRRSTRYRTAPDRLAYQSLGNPLVLIMQSVLGGLDRAFSQALDFDLGPHISTSVPSEVV